jgi:glycosyltransferase involved in cell wall biosynthesis
MIGVHEQRVRPLISVVMAVYDPQPTYLREAIASILAQRLQEWEMIIVEDPSPRSAADILRDVRDRRLRFILNTERTCLVDQKNRGLQEARGEFIAIMDADDIAHPFRFMKQVSFLRNHPEVGLVGSQVGVIDSEDRLVGYRWFPSLHDDIRAEIVRSVPFCHPTVMLRRTVYEMFGGYRFVEFPAAEDYEYWSRLIQSGVRVANIPEPLLYYRIHSKQIKHSKLRETVLAVLRVRELCWSGQLDVHARLQEWGERLLLRVPTRIAAWLLRRAVWHYRPSVRCARITVPTL